MPGAVGSGEAGDGLRVDGTDPNVGPCKGHLEVCAKELLVQWLDGFRSLRVGARERHCLKVVLDSNVLDML